MGILEAFILGLVEGITEFLPISSTGHLILASSILGISQTEFVKSFEIAIQFGAICAVVSLYWKDFFNYEILKRLAIAFIPTGILGLIFYDFLKTYLLGNELVVVSALLLGGIALIAFEYLHKGEPTTCFSITDISYKQSLIVGTFQALAIIPGVSRSAATIIGGLLIGINRTVIVEFSFLLAVPTMLIATSFDLLQTRAVFSGEDMLALAIGFITAFAVALLAIKFLLAFVREHSFIPFGIYRIVVACVFFAFFVL